MSDSAEPDRALVDTWPSTELQQKGPQNTRETVLREGGTVDADTPYVSVAFMMTQELAPTNKGRATVKIPHASRITATRHARPSVLRWERMRGVLTSSIGGDERSSGARENTPVRVIRGHNRPQEGTDRKGKSQTGRSPCLTPAGFPHAYQHHSSRERNDGTVSGGPHTRAGEETGELQRKRNQKRGHTRGTGTHSLRRSTEASSS